MIGLDTNILIRYLTQDDPVQSPKATEVIERRLSLASFCLLVRADKNVPA
jgi:predicted nucleic-acid-binding protein